MTHHCGMLSPLSSVTPVALMPTASILYRLVACLPHHGSSPLPIPLGSNHFPRIPRSRPLPHTPPEQGREHDVIPTRDRPLGFLVLPVFSRRRYDSPRLTPLRTK